MKLRIVGEVCTIEAEGALELPAPFSHPETAVRVLNDLLDTDPGAMQRLFDMETSCSLRMVDHGGIETGYEPDGFKIGVMSVVNALFGLTDEGEGCIVAEYKDGRLVGFCEHA
jgi:hypothetical protein